MQLFRSVLALTVLSVFCSFAFIIRANRYLAETNLSFAPTLSTIRTIESGNGTNADIDDNPFVELRTSEIQNASLTESLRFHVPFVASRFAGGTFIPLRLPNETFQCTKFDATNQANSSKCSDFLNQQESIFFARKFSYNGRPAPTAATAAFLTAGKLRCLDASLIFVELSQNDLNPRNWLMRLMLTWHIVARTDASPQHMPLAGHRVVIFLCPDKRCMSALNGAPGYGHPFHVGSIRSLLVPPKMRTDIIVARSVHSALEGLYWHAVAHRSPAERANDIRLATNMSSPQVLCFRSAVHALGFNNRFAFPDMELGKKMAWNSTTSLAAPLSTDLIEARQLALESSGFAHLKGNATLRNNVPMRPKLLYVRRGMWDDRRWSYSSEGEFVHLLARVASRTGFQLLVADSSGWPVRDFTVQVRSFADAALIVGMHGAGLSLALFAPRGAKVVELEPGYRRRVDVFKSVEAAGIGHEFFRLSAESDDSRGWTSKLLDTDAKRLEELLVKRAGEINQEQGLGASPVASTPEKNSSAVASEAKM